jgi:hypothetical protein
VSKSRRIRSTECGARIGERRCAFRVLVEENPRKGYNFERPRHRMKDNIKMDLQEIGCGGIDWIDLAQNRDRWQSFVNVVFNLRILYNTGNF